LAQIDGKSIAALKLQFELAKPDRHARVVRPSCQMEARILANFGRFRRVFDIDLKSAAMFQTSASRPPAADLRIDRPHLWREGRKPQHDT